MKRSEEDGSLSVFISNGLLGEGVVYAATEATLLGVIANKSLLFVFEEYGWKMSGVAFETSLKGSYCLEGVVLNGSSKLEKSWNKSLGIALENGLTVLSDDGEIASTYFGGDLLWRSLPLSVGTA